MKRYFFFTILFYLVFLTFVSYKVSKAYFTDMAVASANTFTAAAEFPTTTITPTPDLTGTPTPTPTGEPTVNAGDVVINEVFNASTNNAEWVEIHNKTPNSIDVSGWSITDNSETDVFPTIPAIPAGGYAVIVASGTVVTVPEGASTIVLADTTIGGGLAAAGDRLVLTAPVVGVIDQMSWGDDTTILNPSITSPTTGNSLARNPNGTDTDLTADWMLDATPSIGVSND